MPAHQNNEITVWISQLDKESPEAFEKVWQHFYERLVQFAARKLNAGMRRESDEEDVAVGAMHSLYRGVQEGRFPVLQSRDDLWKVLLTIAGAKANKQIRRQMAQKRGGGGVRGESVFLAAGDDHPGLANVAGREPTPEFAELVSVECQERLDQLDDDLLRNIALMKLQGHSNEEIAQANSCALRSVERKLARIRVIWSEN